MKPFRCPEIAQLKHELSLSPARHRLQHIAGIARAIALIDPKCDYPASIISAHITGYRPRSSEDVQLDGKSLRSSEDVQLDGKNLRSSEDVQLDGKNLRSSEDVQLDGKNLLEDLVNLADALTASKPIPDEAAAGRLYDAEELAGRFKVSVRTITRWRRRGLLGCWYAKRGAAARLAFTSKNVQRFIADNIDLVKRGAAFNLMGRKEKAQLIAKARELAATGQRTLHAVTLSLAEETGRAVETIRYTLRKYDQENPDKAIFDNVEQANKVDEADLIYQAFTDGDSTRQLAERFKKSEEEIRKTLLDVRVKELTAKPIEYMYDVSFDAPGAAATIMAPLDNGDESEATDDIRVSRPPADLPAYLQELYRTPLLTPAEERNLFQQMNFVLHQAESLRRSIADAPAKATAANIAAVDEKLAEANDIKNNIIQANLRLVVSFAKRHLRGNASANLFELVSDGNIALMRAVEKFDFARGFRFSTYASWAIVRAYAKSVPGSITHADRFRTGHEEVLASVADHRVVEPAIESSEDHLKAKVNDSLASLNDRERKIVELHFGLNGEAKPLTLEQISHELKLSKERIRQIKHRALSKMRGNIGEAGAELLAS